MKNEKFSNEEGWISINDSYSGVQYFYNIKSKQYAANRFTLVDHTIIGKQKKDAEIQARKIGLLKESVRLKHHQVLKRNIHPI